VGLIRLEMLFAEADRQVRAIAGLAGEILLSNRGWNREETEEAKDGRE